MIAIGKHPEDAKLYRLTAEQRLPAPLDEVFPFFADAFQLERITPPWLHFSVLTEAPIEMQTGALIDYKLRLRGVPLKWRTEISLWEPPVRFVDQQLRGPYKVWRHLHVFREEDGQTIVYDQVDYRVPGGPLVHWLLVRRDLERIFQYRHDRLDEIFPAA